MELTPKILSLNWCHHLLSQEPFTTRAQAVIGFDKGIFWDVALDYHKFCHYSIGR